MVSHGEPSENTHSGRYRRNIQLCGYSGYGWRHVHLRCNQSCGRIYRGSASVYYYGTANHHAATGGQIFLNSQDITHLPFYQRSRLHIGYLPQENSVFRGLSVEDNIMAILEVVEPNREKRQAKLDALLDEFSITFLRKAPATSLSGGERRRVEIARALANDPKFILLDEPFAGIDPIAVNEIRELVSQLKHRGLGVIITDHNVRETLGITDRSYVLHDGKILKHGTTDEIVKDDKVKKVYLGENFTM